MLIELYTLVRTVPLIDLCDRGFAMFSYSTVCRLDARDLRDISSTSIVFVAGHLLAAAAASTADDVFKNLR